MAELLRLLEVHLERGGSAPLRGVSFTLAEGDKVGLVGANGAGKTTLLELLAGRLEPTAGQLLRAPGLRVAQVAQQTQQPGWRGSLWEVAARGLEHVWELEAALRDAETRLHSDAQLGRYAELTAMFEQAGGYGAEATLKAHLSRLGFEGADYRREVITLSGGERARLGLAQALAAQPDLLLLDEPSSFLDLPTKAWLAETLARSKSALLLASHDRALLDAVCRRTLHLKDGVVTGYRGGYSRFQAQAGHAAARKLRELRRAAHERRTLQARIREQPTLSTRRALKRRLERLPDAPQARVPKTTTLTLAAPPTRPNSFVLEAKHLTLTEGERPLLRDVSLRLHAGDKVALVGPNGSGKTTLLRLLIGDLASEDPEAAVRFGPNVKLAVFDQHRRGLDDGLAVGEQLSRSVSEPRARSLLALVGLAEAYDRTPETLSSGERARAGVARLLATEANLLLLDEPSEHLDIETAEKLEAALQDTAATLIVVSHDAALIDAVATRVLGLDGGKLSEYRGGLAGFYAGTLRLEPDLPETLDTDPTALSAEENPDAALEALEDEAVATEARLADPIGLSERDRARLERRLLELSHRRSEHYDARLPAPLPRYRVVEAGFVVTSDGPPDPAGPITLNTTAGVTLQLYRDEQSRIGHLHLMTSQSIALHSAARCLLPWAEQALLRGAARLAFEYFGVCALQLQRKADLAPADLTAAGFTAAGDGWWVQDRDRYAHREGLLRPEGRRTGGSKPVGRLSHPQSWRRWAAGRRRRRTQKKA